MINSVSAHKKTERHIKYLETIKIFRRNYFKEYVTCTCGAVLRSESMFNHKKTKRHKNKVNMELERKVDLMIYFD
jgi:hypothetical protein